MADRKKRGDLGKEKSSKKKAKTSGKRVKEIHVRRAKSGHIIAKHIHERGKDGIPPEDEESVVPEGGMDDHIAEHLPMQPEEQEPAPGAAPSPAPGGMMGAMQ